MELYIRRATAMALLSAAALLNLYSHVECSGQHLTSFSDRTIPRRLQQQQQNGSSPAATGPVGTTASDMSRDVFEFWLSHGPDTESGGFHGTLNRQGAAVDPTSKTLVQQARHLWAMSALLMSGKQQQLSPAARSAADSLFSFMKDHMLTTVALSNGQSGQAFVYKTNRAGTSVEDPSINVYANAFAIYGLSKYAQATGSSEALNLALATFNTLDALYHNPTTGGYDESNTIGGSAFDSIDLPESSSSGGKQKSQAFNTLLHVMEALTELSRATGGSNAAVQARLLEHVQLLTGPLVVPSGDISYIAPNYDPRATWKPVGGRYVSYGHNIEAAWLLDDAVNELAARGTVDSSTAASTKAVLQNIGRSAAQLGYDSSNGGFYETGGVNQGSAGGNKIFWVQAEALIGLDWLYRMTGQQQYKDQLEGVLSFVRQYMWDKQYGEWFWQVPAAGGGPLGFSSGGVPYDSGTKGTWWKASYHTGRAMLVLESRGY